MINNQQNIDNLRIKLLYLYYYKSNKDNKNIDIINNYFIEKSGSKNLVYNFTFSHLNFLCDNGYLDSNIFDGIPLDVKINEKGRKFLDFYYNKLVSNFNEFEDLETLNNLSNKELNIINLYNKNKRKILKESLINLNILDSEDLTNISESNFSYENIQKITNNLSNDSINKIIYELLKVIQ